MEKASSIPQVNSLSSLPAITSVPKKANGSFLACHFKPLFLSFVWWGLPSGPFVFFGGGRGVPPSSDHLGGLVLRFT